MAQEVASYKGKLRGVYEDSSDFDRIKIRAENLYLQGDYEGCARYARRPPWRISRNVPLGKRRHACILGAVEG